MPKLHNFDENCYHFKPDKRISISLKDPKSEAGKIYRATNANGKLIVVLSVETCLMKDAESDKKCDYLLLVFPNSQKIEGAVAYFIELKGQDLKTAFSQIRSSYTFCKDKLKGFEVKVRVAISKYSVMGDLKSNPHYVFLKNNFGEKAIEKKEFFNDIL